MTQLTVGENEGIESALRRFKRQVSKSGIFADLKRLRHHETPIEKYKRKLQQRRKARRRWFPKFYIVFYKYLILLFLEVLKIKKPAKTIKLKF